MKKKKKKPQNKKKISGNSAKSAKQNTGNLTIVFVIETKKKIKKGHAPDHGENGHIS